MQSAKSTRMKLISVYLLMLCFAISISLVGQMLVPIRIYYGISIEQANMLLSAQSIGGVTIAIISILFIDSMNQRKLIVMAGLILACILMCMSFLPPLMVTSLAFIAIGLSAGLVNVLSNSVMVGVAKANKQRYLTIMHMVFSIGAFIIPLIAQSIFDFGGLNGTFLIIGSAMLLCTMVAVFAFREEMQNKIRLGSLDISHRFSELKKVLSIKGIKPIFVLAVLVSIWQMCSIYNISGAVSSINGKPAEGALALSALFFGMIISRLLYSTVADRFSPGKVLAVMNISGAAIWTVAMLSQNITLKIVLIAMSAVACGVNYPIIYGAACKIANKNTAAASGLVAFGYYIAIFVFSPITGSLCDTLGYSYGLLTLAIPLVLALPLGILLHKSMNRNLS